jgi:alkylhydroperoxidase family enzyme
MTWIKTVSLAQTDEKLRTLLEKQRALYPIEYAEPAQPLPEGEGLPGIVGSHTLIPEAMYHAFSTFGALMSPDLPLRRRDHEMIATVVSATNRCRY